MTSRRYKELSANTALFAISTFGSKLVQFLLLPLYTSALSTADYGMVDLVQSTVSLLVPVLTLNVQDAVLRFGLGGDAESEEVLSIGLRSVAGGACALLVVLAAATMLGAVPVDEAYTAFLLAMFLLGSLGNVLTMHLKSQGHIRPLVVSGIGGTLVTCVAAVLLLIAIPLGVVGYMAAMALGSLFSVCVLLVAERISLGVILCSRPGLFRAMAMYSAPLIANSLAWWVSDLSDRYVVALICGAAANGVYAVAFKIPTILSTLQSIFYNAWSISAIKEFNEDDEDGFLGRMYGLYSCAMCLGCSVIMLLDVPLAHILYANEFFEAWRYVPFLLVGVLLNGLSLFEGCIYAAARRTKEVSATTIAGAVVGIGSCIVLTFVIGPMGAAIATFLGHLVTWGVRTMVLVKRVTRIKVSWPTEIAGLLVLVIQATLAIWWGTQPVQLIAFVALVIIYRRRLGGVVGVVSQRFS
ncbi:MULTISPECIES: lipopolysaccharide biosynthesis protein [unclassified Adlercreutzia]|uniref:lipopolysaccharide biosynthesis protein n=1 Tax=unclassified Adlercreutzia TaxID=2636013 RepID=UPI0013EC3F74|nr:MULTISPECIES: lipopolysaccharide biosynthesis protein [unclassified Adlercreutzia]